MKRWLDSPLALFLAMVGLGVWKFMAIRAGGRELWSDQMDVTVYVAAGLVGAWLVGTYFLKRVRKK